LKIKLSPCLRNIISTILSNNNGLQSSDSITAKDAMIWSMDTGLPYCSTVYKYIKNMAVNFNKKIIQFIINNNNFSNNFENENIKRPQNGNAMGKTLNQ